MKAKFYSYGIALVVFMFASLKLSAQTPTITLLQPTDPGIEWTVGGTYVISWIDNFPHGVDILLTDDYGTTFDTIVKNVTGSVYYWNTTGVALGTHYKIKVESTLANSYSDMSSHTFKVVDQAGGSITLEQPTGGEIWSEGNTYLLSWFDNLTAPVMVELLQNNSPIDTLVASTTGSTTYWTIPTGLASSGYIYKIRVSSTVTGATTAPAVSGSFKIIASSATYVEVYQPNGGESWARGTTHLISWNDDLTEPVNIELYSGSTKVADIATDVTGTTFWWTIDAAQTTGNYYRIYVRSTLDPTHVYDRSNGYFHITAGNGTFVEVYQPNGGESWARGTTHLISWNDDVVEPVNIELYSGSTKVADIATDVTGTTYWWTIDAAQTTGNHYRIFVRSTLDPTHLYDHSNGYFHITASSGDYLEVYQPNGGESWARNTTHLISWNDDLTEPVNIELYSGSTKVADIATNVTGSTYWWTIDAAQATGNYYRIFVRSTLDPTHLYDHSNGYFHITASTGTYVEVYQPNGGESWARGTAHLVSWNDDFPEGVNIILKQGSTIKDTIGLDVLGSTYVWDIPSTTATGNYKVEIYSTLDSLHLHDFSNGNFAITASEGTYVEVLQPNGGEVWAAGTSYWISWNDDFLEGVNIALWKNGSFDSYIATDVLGSAYSWAIPVTQTPGTYYKVEVYSTLDSLNLKDFSDGYFEIVPQTMMSVYPNPANNQVTINLKNTQEKGYYSIRLFDRFNKQVVELQTNSTTTTLSTAGLVNGVYFVVVTTDKTRVTGKIVVQH